MAKDKTLIDVEVCGHPVIIENKFVGTLANYRDIRERKHMVEALDEQRAYFKQLFDNSPDGIVMLDLSERVVDANKGFCKMFGYDKVETIGECINDLIAPENMTKEAEKLSAKVIGGGNVKYQSKRKSKTGSLIDVDILAFPVEFNNKSVGAYAIYSDITEKKQAEKKIETLAYRDSLTGLFNRRVFYDKLKEKIQNIGKGQRFAVCYIDLDGFKRVNDSMGHNVGDELLRYVAKNIEDSMGEEDVVARIGGDEFVIFTDCVDHEKIGAKMESIIGRLNSGLKIFDYSIKISLSIGVAIYPDHGNNVEEIIKKADTAMYMAKRNALRGYLIFTDEMDKNTNDRFKLENRLKMALVNGEIEMHYQPILSMDGRVKGCEALMRWTNPVIGKISPEVFIPIAEDSGEIHQLGKFAFVQAVIVLKKWKKRFGDDFFMSINLSVKQMERENIVDMIAEIMKNSEVEGKNIHLEITESCSTENVCNLKEKILRLKEMGFAISIDDFGTGYSSFMQLRDSYVNFLKIDRSFVDSIEKRDDNRAIVKAIIVMGKSLGVGIIAEGVETESELKIMKRLGCNMYQGYLTQRPGNEKIIEAFIKKNVIVHAV
jgi:diguanylate cyclase (GGDEF)-like protein/PAS domain S-box-containing protein